MASEAGLENQPDVATLWGTAQKMATAIRKETEKLKRTTPTEIADARWRSLEDLMSQYRLACVHVLFKDFDFAQKNQVEKGLWTCHTLINAAYRHVCKRLPSDMKARVRSVEGRYSTFIKTSQLFYKGYIQRLSMRYNLGTLHRVASAVHVEHGPGQDAIRSISSDTRAKVIRSLLETLTNLGDLSRYRGQIKPNSHDNQTAITYYSLAHDVEPDRGHALHQIAMASANSDRHLEMVYYFLLSLARSTPHPNAEVNLEAKLKGMQSGKTLVLSSQSTQQILEGRLVQLYAQYMDNTPFPGRDELEKTVLARLEQFLQSAHPEESVVRMALVGIGAYHYAQKREAHSLSSAHILSFALQFLRVICQFILRVLGELQGIMPGEQDAPVSRIEQLLNASPGINTATRVLRLYSCWLATHGDDLAHPPPAIEVHVDDTWRVFAQTVTNIAIFLAPDLDQFCKTQNQAFPPTSPYLLKEDEEAVCYLAIGDTTSEVYLRLFHQDASTRKPTVLEFDGQALDSKSEFIFRVGDILSSTQHLSNSPLFPLAIHISEGEHPAMEFGYSITAEAANEGTAEMQEEAENTGVEAMSPNPPAPLETPFQGPESNSMDQESFGQSVDVPVARELSLGGAEINPSTAQVAVVTPTFPIFPWHWFHEPNPRGLWLQLTREVWESLPTAAPAQLPEKSGPKASAAGQREMLLTMLRSASQATPQEAYSTVSISGYANDNLAPGQPGHTFVPNNPLYYQGMSSGLTTSIADNPPALHTVPVMTNVHGLYTQEPGAEQLFIQQSSPRPHSATQRPDSQAGARAKTSRAALSSRRARHRTEPSQEEAARLSDLRKRTIARIQQNIKGP